MNIGANKAFHRNNFQENELKVIDFLVELSRRYFDPKKVYLFGSRARRDHRVNSDFDFALDSPTGAMSSNWSVFMDQIREEVPSLCSIDVIQLSSNLDSALVKNIVDEGILVYER